MTQMTSQRAGRSQLDLGERLRVMAAVADEVTVSSVDARRLASMWGMARRASGQLTEAKETIRFQTRVIWCLALFELAQFLFRGVFG